jgi:hypothetical protein
MRFFRIRLSDVLHAKACEKKGADFFDTAASLASDLSPPPVQQVICSLLFLVVELTIDSVKFSVDKPLNLNIGSNEIIR